MKWLESQNNNNCGSYQKVGNPHISTEREVEI